MARTKEAVRTEPRIRKVEAIGGPGTYLLRPEGSGERVAPDLSGMLLGRLREIYPGAFLSGDSSDSTQEIERDEPRRSAMIAALEGGKVYSIRRSDYQRSSAHALLSRFVIAGRYKAVGELFRLSVSDDPSITHGIAPWLATLEYKTSDPRGLIHTAVEIVNAIIVPRRLGIYIET